MSFIYLASPYKHKDKAVMEARYRAALDATGILMKRGMVIFSPIVHCHNIAVEKDLPRDIDFWMNYDFAMLSKAAAILVLCLEGWEDSVGVRRELEFCREHKIPDLYYWPEDRSHRFRLDELALKNLRETTPGKMIWSETPIGPHSYKGG